MTNEKEYEWEPFGIQGHSLKLLRRCIDEEELNEEFDRACVRYKNCWEDGNLKYPENADIELQKIKTLVNIKHACPVCGRADCDDGVAYIDGGNMIHESEHPENHVHARSRSRKRQLHRFENKAQLLRHISDETDTDIEDLWEQYEEQVE